MFSRFRVDVAVVVTAALVTGLVACTGKAPASRPPAVPRYATSLAQAEGDVVAVKTGPLIGGVSYTTALPLRYTRDGADTVLATSLPLAAPAPKATAAWWSPGNMRGHDTATATSMGCYEDTIEVLEVPGRLQLIRPGSLPTASSVTVAGTDVEMMPGSGLQMSWSPTPGAYHPLRGGGVVTGDGISDIYDNGAAVLTADGRLGAFLLRYLAVSVRVMDPAELRREVEQVTGSPAPATYPLSTLSRYGSAVGIAVTPNTVTQAVNRAAGEGLPPC